MGHVAANVAVLTYKPNQYTNQDESGVLHVENNPEIIEWNRLKR